MLDIETRRALVDAMGSGWKKRLIAARLALIDGRRTLMAAGVDPECLGGVVEVIGELIEVKE